MDIRQAAEELIRKFYPDDGFGCACTPRRQCGTCQWRMRLDPLRLALSSPQASPQEGSPDSFGYALGMRVMQSNLYPLLDGREQT